jgi:hypothetical protein
MTTRAFGVWMLVALGAAVGVGCAGTAPPPTSVSGGAAGQCASGPVHQGALGILGDVAVALVGDDYEAQLATLAQKAGDPAVTCAVQEMTAEATKKADRTSDPIEMQRAAHGRAWLTARKVA